MSNGDGILYTYVLTGNPVGFRHLTLRQSGAEADVGVRVRTGIVQIDVEDAGVGAVVPVAPA